MKSARTALVLALSFACLLTPRQSVHAQNAPGNAQKIVFSKPQGISDLFKKYPFLDNDLQLILKVQDIASGHIRARREPDMVPYALLYTAQNKGQGTDLFFLKKKGLYFCHDGECPVTVYVGHGNRYTNAITYMSHGSIRVSRRNGNILLFINRMGKSKPAEWMLMGNAFIPANALQQLPHIQQAPVRKETAAVPPPAPKTSAPSQSAPSSSSDNGGNDTFIP